MTHVAAYRAAVAGADAILLTTPAYNGIDGRGRQERHRRGLPPPWCRADRRQAGPGGRCGLLPGADERVLEHATTALRIAGAKPLERTFGITKHVEAFGEGGSGRQGSRARVARPSWPTCSAGAGELISPAAGN